MTHHEKVADLMAKNAQLREALTAAQWGFNHVRCPLCAGWMMGPNGETDMKHTPDCIIVKALND